MHWIRELIFRIKHWRVLRQRAKLTEKFKESKWEVRRDRR